MVMMVVTYILGDLMYQNPRSYGGIVYTRCIQFGDFRLLFYVLLGSR